MKHLKLIIALLVATSLVYSCKSKDKKPVKIEKQTGIKATSEVLLASEIELIEGNLNFVSTVAERDAAMKAPRKKAPPTIVVVAVEPTLTHNSGSSFTINYNGQADVIWTFHRCGNEQSTTSGNVIPLSAGPSFYRDTQPTRTYDSWCSGLFYQTVVVSGSLVPDANGVIGTNWTMSYSNPTN